MSRMDADLERTAARHLAFGWWLVVASIGGAVSGQDPSTGATRWVVEPAAGISSDPVSLDGATVVVADEQGLFALPYPVNDAGAVIDIKVSRCFLNTAVYCPVVNAVIFLIKQADLEGLVINNLTCLMGNVCAESCHIHLCFKDGSANNT